MAARSATLGGDQDSLPAKTLISQRQRAYRSFMRNKSAVVGMFMIVALVIIAVFAPWIAPYDPLTQSITTKFQPPSWQHWPSCTPPRTRSR